MTRTASTSPGVAACCALLCLVLEAAAGAQAGNGRIEGRVQRASGDAIRAVSVVLVETSATAITGNDGRFAFGGLRPGPYTVILLLGENTTTLTGVVVTAGQTTTIEPTVDWDVGLAESLVVVAPSRRLERVIDAPGAATAVSESEIEQRASHGQLPKLVEFLPGAQVTQSGVYDFNLNTRGFNTTLNRRVATLVDGRDPSIPFLGSQEWSAIPFPLDDLSGLEWLRGPSAALYGANASSGVLNMLTKAPRDSPGGTARVTVGELSTVNVDFRWAGELGDGWYAKAVGAARSHDDYAVSRTGGVEYSTPCAPGASGDCLPEEAVALARTNDRIFSGGLRLDRYLDNGMVLALEGGVATLRGPVYTTGIGRIQFLDVKRPWARVDLHGDRFDVLAYYTARKAPEHLGLSAGSLLADSSRRLQVEGQTNFTLADDRVRVVVGGSVADDRIDTFSESVGRQTALFEPVNADKQAVFGQADWDVNERVKLVGAERVDWSSIHDAQVSPKAALVYTAHENHSLRLTYSEAFQVPNYAELFLQADAAPAADLSPFEAFCAPFGVECGFATTRVLGVGNRDLELETIRTWEIGYKGLVGGRTFATVDYYRATAENFVSDLLPQLGTSLGVLNPSFGPWHAPTGVPAVVEQTVRALAPPILSNNFDGSPILVAASYTNFGEVHTQGLDLSIQHVFPRGWQASLAYSWFDFEFADPTAAADALHLPNTPAHTVSAGLRYERAPLDVGVDARWVDAFEWGVGPFRGPVEAYTVVDLSANRQVSEHVSVGVNVANLFDNRHWEAFGGDLLRRRALVHLTYRW